MKKSLSLVSILVTLYLGIWAAFGLYQVYGAVLKPIHTEPTVPTVDVATLTTVEDYLEEQSEAVVATGSAQIIEIPLGKTEPF